MPQAEPAMTSAAMAIFPSARVSRRPSMPPRRRLSSSMSRLPFNSAATDVASARPRNPMAATNETLSATLVAIVARLTATAIRL